MLKTFQELQAIEKHELEMIALGNQYIMKSHKGEIEIDKDEFIKEKEKGELAVYKFWPVSCKPFSDSRTFHESWKISHLI